MYKPYVTLHCTNIVLKCYLLFYPLIHKETTNLNEIIQQMNNFTYKEGNIDMQIFEKKKFCSQNAIQKCSIS